MVMCLEDNDLNTNRAWIEINVKNLRDNVKVIKDKLKDGCEIMAVVKANAYGHGMILIAKELNKIGIRNFAVATLEEAIKLRREKIIGEILILGYTDFKNVHYIYKYDLTQTIVDYDYARKLNASCDGLKIKSHVKINTGMNRIGESYKNLKAIVKIYSLDNLNITGIYTHLCCADSKTLDDIKFTKDQVKNFFSCVNELKKKVPYVGKTHVQSSYGLLNYPDIKCDFVRIGLIMYGVNESKNHMPELVLKPVLKLKARITSVKYVNSGEFVSYGRTFKALEKMKVATVSIGYADGYPRGLSNKNMKVMVNDKPATVIGKICMDQLVIDATNIMDIKDGDEVTLIGNQDGIRAEDLALKTDTITYEILSRLGSRLARIKCLSIKNDYVSQGA